MVPVLSEAAKRFNNIPGVEQVRYEEFDEGYTFWVLGNNLSEEAQTRIVRAHWELVEQFGETAYIGLAIRDRFGAPRLYSRFWYEETVELSQEEESHEQDQ